MSKRSNDSKATDAYVRASRESGRVFDADAERAAAVAEVMKNTGYDVATAALVVDREAGQF